jgi:hypothetical protein
MEVRAQVSDPGAPRSGQEAGPCLESARVLSTQALDTLGGPLPAIRCEWRRGGRSNRSTLHGHPRESDGDGLRRYRPARFLDVQESLAGYLMHHPPEERFHRAATG